MAEKPHKWHLFLNFVHREIIMFICLVKPLSTIMHTCYVTREFSSQSILIQLVGSFLKEFLIKSMVRLQTIRTRSFKRHV